MASVTKQLNGTWRVRYRDPGGKQRSKNFKRKVDADKYAVTVEHSKSVGSYVDPAAGRVAFRTYAEKWRSRQVHRPSTRAQVETNLRCHVYPAIGARPVSSIRQNEIQALVVALGHGGEDGPGLAPSTVRVIYSWLASVFKDAELNRAIGRSPCEQIKLQEVGRSKVVPMDVETVQSLASAVPERYRGLILLGAGTGVRVSEALGLTLDRLDLTAGYVTIDRQLTKVVNGKPVFGPVKDKKNRPRTIPLARSTVEALREHLRRWPPHEDGLVFTNDAGEPVRRNTFSDIWRKAAAPLGVLKGEGYHQLRHFYASLLIRHGESVKVVQERLGHSSAQMTLDVYSHLWPDSDDTTREAVDAVFGVSDVSDLCQAA